MPTVPDGSRCSKAQAGTELEALDRLAAVRLVADAMLAGSWALDPEVVEGMAQLLATSRRWAEQARVAA